MFHGMSVRRRVVDVKVIERDRHETTVKRKSFSDSSGWEADEIIRGDTLVVDRSTGEPALLQIGVDPQRIAYLRALLRRASTQKLWASAGERMSGLHYQFATFGYLQRTPLWQRDCCSSSAMNVSFPHVYGELEDLTTELLLPPFQEWAPGPYGRQAAFAEEILPEWRIGGKGPWTSGIINNTAQLQYHADTKNIPGSWSAMLVLRQFVRGGHLHIPEYRLLAECADAQLIFFCGSDLLHGVTPFRIVQGEKRKAYRLSLVWYSGAGLKECLPMEQEIAFGKRARTAREERAAAGRS